MPVCFDKNKIMSSTMQLDFTQAMADFKTMFPDMDDDVIEAVLRANQGAVDATIDQLLAMSTDNQNEKLRQEIEEDETGTPSKKTPKKLVRLIEEDEILPADDITEDVALCKIHKWKPPLLGPLPATFLRLEQNGDSKELLGDNEDERIALFLQNEEFMAELRWNQDFLSALESEGHSSKKSHEDEAVFKERLKNMGKLSRKKFTQLTRMFTWQSKKAGPTRSRPGPAPDSLLLQEEHSDEEAPAKPSAETRTHK